jgi:hypothetical protein
MQGRNVNQIAIYITTIRRKERVAKMLHTAVTIFSNIKRMEWISFTKVQIHGDLCLFDFVF